MKSIVYAIFVQDIYQDVEMGTARSRRSIGRPPPIYVVNEAPLPEVAYTTSQPSGTFYHALGRPFGVAFNNSTFNSPASEGGFYSTMGKKVSESFVV